MICIPIANTTDVALVDDADEALVRQYKWSLLKSRKGPGKYAKATATVSGKRTTVLMHRLILGLKHHDGIEPDHANLNGLDNRRENLRIATRSLNTANVGKRRGKDRPGRTKYKGVYWRESHKQFAVQCGPNRKFVGLFRTAEEAAMAYNVTALRYFGEFAKLNPVEMG